MTTPDFAGLGDRTARSPLGQQLGWQCESITADRARLRMPYVARNTTVGEMVHGGAIAALADAAATAACWATDAATPGSRGATVALNVNYLQAALAVDLVADARVVRRGGSICVADVEVTRPDGEIVAVARATYKLSHRGA
jgi:uncharacterized protein (TIGR00369 family)